jgi:hypothetical protein
MAAVTVSVFLGCSILGVQAQVSLARQEVVNVPTKALAGLSHGMTQIQVEDALGARGNHEFTTVGSNTTIRCIAYYRSEVFGKYYLVFTNDYLSAVCEPPPFQMRRVPYEGSWSNESVLGDPEVRIAKVLSAPDMIGPALVAALKPATPPKRSWDPGLTAAYLLTRKLFTDKTQEAQRESAYRALLEKYDPFRIDLGITLQVVEARLGKPRITEALDVDREMRYYGSVEYGLMGSRKLMWMVLVVDKGKVIRVFTDDFVDYEKVRKLEEKSAGIGGASGTYIP